jgi:salicylate hydroxylase
MPSDLQVAIIGGGIGGLAAAIALRQVGVAAVIYERAPQMEEVGAGCS